MAHESLLHNNAIHIQTSHSHQSVSLSYLFYIPTQHTERDNVKIWRGQLNAFYIQIASEFIESNCLGANDRIIIVVVRLFMYTSNKIYIREIIIIILMFGLCFVSYIFQLLLN